MRHDHDHAAQDAFGGSIEGHSGPSVIARRPVGTPGRMEGMECDAPEAPSGAVITHFTRTSAMYDIISHCDGTPSTHIQIDLRSNQPPCHKHRQRSRARRQGPSSEERGGMFVIDRIRQQQGGPAAGGARPRRKRSGLSAVANHVMSTLVFFGSIRLIYMWKNRHALA